MEPLLRGEGSGGRRDHARGIFRRSDAITYGSNYEKAAALVDLAEDGVGLPEQILDSSSFQSSSRYYFIFIKCNIMWSLAYFALIVLNFLERPLWCENYTKPSCSDREYFFLGQLPYLTNAECLIYEGLTVVVLIIHTFFPISYEGSRIYWRNAINLLKVFCLLVLIADMLVYAIYLSPAAFDFLPFRVAPYIRVILFILNIRELRETITILSGMVGTYLNVLALGLLFLLFASWVAYVMFEDTIQGKTVFTSYGATLYQIFVLFTTSNNPDVWVPAYKASRWYCLYFIIFVLLGVYFVTNLVLAVVYDSFKSELVKQVFEMDRMRRAMLEKAFNLLDTHSTGYLNKDQCIRLFEELNKYRTLPKITKEEFELIFDELDDSRDVKLNKDEFADICHAIALKFQKEDSISYFEYLPFYNSPTSKQLKEFVKRPIFGYLVSFLLVLNLVAVIIETTLDIQNNSGQKVWQVVEFIFGWIYVIEMALKVYAYGFENYWRDGQNRFDFVITWIIDFLLEWRMDPLPSSGKNVEVDKAPNACQAIPRLCCNFLNAVAKFDAILWDHILCLMYLLLGWCTENSYLLFNFNDYPNGMVTLFNLVVMGNWQVWMQSYKELTGTSWTYVYFISFYLVTVLLLLNLVVAFVLEAFFAEMELESPDTCDEQDKDAGKSHFLSCEAYTDLSGLLK
ncbi:hypothetical protein Ahy_A08g039791 isoform F [Arachis hypogaea]|uniref:EF-hand domain-containing protein n=1 Tax=Arachis hypogaea TaxID=3818 RepID=A0A445BXV7_ARAHY|nr:hypothetical protein Ahy_A08g039791 isoform F [Arachis hypogaea]